MTILFFLSATVLVCAAIAFVVPIILRESTKGYRIGRRQKNIEIAKQRLDDLNRNEFDEDSGAVDADPIRQEIERGLLDDVEDLDDSEEKDDDTRELPGFGNGLRLSPRF